MSALGSLWVSQKKAVHILTLIYFSDENFMNSDKHLLVCHSKTKCWVNICIKNRAELVILAVWDQHYNINLENKNSIIKSMTEMMCVKFIFCRHCFFFRNPISPVVHFSFKNVCPTAASFGLHINSHWL